MNKTHVSLAVAAALLLLSSAGPATAAVMFIDPGVVGGTYVLFPHVDHTGPLTDLRFEWRFSGGKFVNYSGSSGVFGGTGLYSSPGTTSSTWTLGFLTTSGDQTLESQNLPDGTGGFGLSVVNPTGQALGFFMQRASNDGPLSALQIGSGVPNLTGTVGAVVPEPTTLALFGLGLAGAGIARRRKRKA